MRTIRPLALAVAATLATVGCSSTTNDGGGDAVPEVAATVNGVEIPGERIEEIVDLQMGAVEDAPEDEQADARLQTARQALSAEIQLKAVEGAVEERFGLDIPDEDIDAALEEQIEAQGGQEAFDQLAEDSGLSSDAALGFARDNAYVTVLVEYVQAELADEGGITDEELQAQYDAAPESFQSSEVRHILVETEDEANDVIARLDAGEDFGAVAEEVSNDPGSAANGGSLGEAPRGSYVEPFSDAIYSEDTEIGEVVGPVESQFGFHVLIVDARTTPEFEDVRDQLEAQLVGAQFSDFLQEVFDSAEVEVDPYYGEWDSASRMVVAVAAEGADDGTAGDDAVEGTDDTIDDTQDEATTDGGASDEDDAADEDAAGDDAADETDTTDDEG